MPDRHATSEENEAREARVLVADDDIDFLNYVTGVLRGAGYDVVQVRDGASLLEYLNFASLGPGWELPCDAIVTDFQMPGVTGIEVLEGLAIVGLARRVVVVSGFADAGTLDWARRVGAAGALAKPFREQQLLHLVERAVE